MRTIRRVRWTLVLWFGNASRCNRDYYGGWIDLRTAWGAARHLGSDAMSGEKDDRLRLANELLNQTLDCIEFCEGVILDVLCNEDAVDLLAARRIAEQCSELLTKHGRTSVMVESKQWPVT